MFRKKFRTMRGGRVNILRARVSPGVMKTLLLALSLAAAGASTADAQIYRSAVVNSALLGGIVGAIVGGHNHERWGEGAVIGAAAGALLGAVAEPQRVAYAQPPVTVVQAAPVVAPAAVVAATPVDAQQPVQVVYVPYYESVPVVYAYPAVSVGVGYTWGPRHAVYFRPSYRRW